MPDPHNPEEFHQAANPKWLDLLAEITMIHYRMNGIETVHGFSPGEVVKIDHNTGEPEPMPPITAEEFRVAGATVEGRNAYQMSGLVHPYTCGKHDAAHREYAESHRHHDVGILVATENNGWLCPVCGYTQTGPKYLLQP